MKINDKMHLSYRGFLSKDTVLYLVEFLQPHELLNVFRAWRIGWKYFVPLYESAIKRKIDFWFRNYFGPRYEKFRECMIQDKAIISGSFVLQQILGENWKDSDIDIYMGKGNRKYELNEEEWFQGIENFLYFNKGMTFRGSDNTCPRYNEEIGFENYFEVRDYNINNQFSKFHNAELMIRPSNWDQNSDVFKYTENRYFSGPEYTGSTVFTQFQVIELKRDATIENMLQFVNEIFDFDICKNSFYYDEKGCHIVLQNIDELIHKRTVFKYARAPQSSAKRYLKYKARGIQFTNERDALTLLENK